MGFRWILGSEFNVRYEFFGEAVTVTNQLAKFRNLREIVLLLKQNIFLVGIWVFLS